MLGSPSMDPAGSLVLTNSHWTLPTSDSRDSPGAGHFFPYILSVCLFSLDDLFVFHMSVNMISSLFLVVLVSSCVLFVLKQGLAM